MVYLISRQFSERYKISRSVVFRVWNPDRNKNISNPHPHSLNTEDANANVKFCDTLCTQFFGAFSGHRDCHDYLNCYYYPCGETDWVHIAVIVHFIVRKTCNELHISWEYLMRSQWYIFAILLSLRIIINLIIVYKVIVCRHRFKLIA